MVELNKISNDFRDVIAQIMIFKSNESLFIDVFRNKEKDKIEKYKKEKRPIEHTIHYENIVNKQMEVHIKSFPKLISSMSLIYGVTHFEVFVTDTVLFLLNKFPESLKNKNKNLTYEEILSFKSINNLKTRIIQKEVETIVYGGIKEQLEYLKKQFKLKLDYMSLEESIEVKQSIYFQELIEIYSARNLIIHNNSIVNNLYLKSNKNSKYKLGEKLNITNDYVTHCMYVLSMASQAIHNAINNKLNKKTPPRNPARQNPS